MTKILTMHMVNTPPHWKFFGVNMLLKIEFIFPGLHFYGALEHPCSMLELWLTIGIVAILLKRWLTIGMVAILLK